MQTEWLWGLLGGGLIGCAAAMFLLINGRIMGASGIVGGLIDGTGRHNWAERIAFLAGLVLVPGVVGLSSGAQTYLTTNALVLVAGGLLVGVGTRVANGCTSGHGVCGISRLSLRGIVATIFYIGAGAVTVVIFKHVLGVLYLVCFFLG